MNHIHHIIEFKDGKRIRTDKTITVSVKEHAEYHRRYYEEHGYYQDKMAWLGLEKRMPREEFVRELARQANLGKKQTPEQIEKRVSQLRGRKRTFTKEWREKIGKARRGKFYGGSSKGYMWINNGVKNIYLKPDQVVPEGFVAGRMAWR